MNREDILREVQNNKEIIGESEVHFQRKGAVFATLVGLFLAAVMVIAEYFILHKLDFGKVAIITAVISASDLYEGIKNRCKKQIIYGVICGIVAIVSLFFYVKGVYFG